MSAGQATPEGWQEKMRVAARLHDQGRRSEAIAIFREVLAERPDAAEGWYELGYLLKAEGRYDEALDAYGQALARGIRRPEEVHLNRAVIFSDHLRRDDDAERELRAALALAPQYISALLNLGNLHEERGERDQALACYERILACPAGNEDGLRHEALARIAQLRPPASVDDPLLASIHAALASQVQQPPMVRANLLFALGRSYDRLGEVAPAFDAYTRANRTLLRQAGRLYDRRHSERLTEALMQAFSRPEAATATEDDVSPLFICGMYRSGSTLVEQVLASHPRVIAGGELDFLRRLAAERLAPFPASMAAPQPERDAALADEYRAHVRKLFPQATPGTYVSDKRPDNFMLIGMIKRLFPAARIVHSTRNPMDNGLSVYMQHLHLRVAGYSADLGDIGHYYGQYRRLMAHWKSLYPGDIHDLDYDALVGDPKGTLLPLFEFLGLEWDDRCLNFHELGNTVKTASYWQVRRPLYGSASGRWRRYAAQLAPLRSALLAAGLPASELD